MKLWSVCNHIILLRISSICMYYTHHTIGPGLLKRLLEVSVLQSDMEFLKYLIDDKKVDVNGMHMKFCGLCVIVHCTRGGI